MRKVVPTSPVLNITPEALALFRAWLNENDDDDKAHAYERTLHQELQLKPWHMAVYPEPVGPGWPAAAEGYERFLILKAALAEAEAAEKAAGLAG
jgi:hypothetical protein